MRLITKNFLQNKFSAVSVVDSFKERVIRNATNVPQNDRSLCASRVVHFSVQSAIVGSGVVRDSLSTVAGQTKQCTQYFPLLHNGGCVTI